MKKKLMATLAAICSMFLAAGTVAGILASAESGTPVNMDGNWIETGGGWSKAIEEDGSATIEQTKNDSSSRFALMTGLTLDGLSIDITCYNAGGIYFGSNQWACYETAGGLGLSVNTLYERYNLIIGNTDSESDRKFYDTAESALAQAGAGTTVDGTASGCIIVSGGTAEPVTLNISFERYSTYRYTVTVTSDTLYAGMAHKEGNSVTYYINTKDFPQMFDNNGVTYMVAQGNADGNAKMNIRLAQGEPAADFIEDEDVSQKDELFEQFTTQPQTASEGKKIVTYTQNEVFNTGFSVGTPNENGTVTVDNPEGAQWGDRAGLIGQLQLDGLKLTSYYSDYAAAGSFGSVILSGGPEGYYGENQLCMVYFMAETTQARLYVGNNHNVYGDFVSYLYKSEAGASSRNADDKLANLIVNGAPVKYSVEFTKMSEKVYKMTFVLLNDVTWHEINGFADPKTAEAYINTDDIASLFDADGYVMPSVATNMSVKEGKVVLLVEESENHITDAEVTLDADSVNYDGKPVEPAVKQVKSGDIVFTAEDYDVSYRDNDKVGQASVVITFKNGYTGIIAKPFTILGRLANDAVVTLEYESVMYTTMPNTPEVVSVVLGDTAIDDSNYDVSYANNVEVGTATVTITFKGEYAGTVTKTFEITKIRTEREGEDVSLTYEEASWQKMQTLGDEYTYAVKDADGNSVAADTELKAGTYTVTAVRETSVRIEVVTYTVTIAEPQPGQPGDSSSDGTSGSSSDSAVPGDSSSDSAVPGGSSSDSAVSGGSSSDSADSSVGQSSGGGAVGCGSAMTVVAGAAFAAAAVALLVGKKKRK